MNKKIILILFFIVGIMEFGSQVQAANCGDTDSDGVTEVTCNCGDTVIGAVGYTYQLAGNLVGTEHGLVVGSSGITIDGGGYTITGDGGSSDYGINNSDGYDNVTIKNFSNITSFNTGIYFLNSESNSIENNIVNSNNYNGIFISSGWIERHPAGDVDKNWISVASDFDGSNLIAAASDGRLYTSGDFGIIWTERQPAGDVDIDSAFVASDSDGSNLVAAITTVLGSSRLYTSNNFGANWTERQPAGNVDKNWISIVPDSDGSNLVAAVSDGRLYTGVSADGGVTYAWTEQYPPGGAPADEYWNSIAFNSDGSRLFAAILGAGGKFYAGISADGGVTYTWDEYSLIGVYWSSVASDSDGSNLIAVDSGVRLYTSSNFGASWTERQPAGNTDKSWSSVASDSDGSNLIAIVSPGQIYISSDSGTTWIERQPAGNTDKYWTSIASDSDGSNLIAADLMDGRLYTSDDYGVSSSSDSNTLTNNTANSNANNGIYLSYSDSNTLANNAASLNNNDGIYLSYSDSNILTNNTANSNIGSLLNQGGNPVHSIGIHLAYSSYNYLGLDSTPGTGNITNSNSNTGIYIFLGSDNHLNYNTTNSNGTWGALIYGSDNNTLTSNTANLNGQYGIQFDALSGGTISGNTSNSNVFDGIYLYAATDATIENNTVQGNSYSGMRIRYLSDNNIITGNIIKSNRYGIHLSENSSNTFTNNIISSNTSDGIHLESSLSNIIANNTFYNALSQFALAQINNSTGTLLKNNIVYGDKYISVANGSQTGSQYNYNDYYGGSGNYFNWRGTGYSTFANWKTNSGQDSNSLNSDPLFTNAAGDDFSLQFSSSVIDAGLDANINTDYAGKQRYDHPDITNTGSSGSYTKTYVDMGAYEYVTLSDPVLTSGSYPSETTWYNDATPDMSLSSNNSETNHYHYLVNQTASPTKIQVEAGTEDSDGIFTVPAGIINSDGTWYVHIIAQNLDNDSSTNFDTYTIKYDGMPPAVFELSLPVNNSWQNDSKPTLYWNSSSDLTSGLAKYQLYIDGILDTDNINITSTSITPTNSLNDGSHTWYVKAIDNAGNARQSTSIYTIKIDTGSPPSHPTDTDSDGMSDTWETANGLDPFDPADADTDADNDGWTNLQEYQFGFDPNNASPFKPIGISPVGVGITLTPILEGSDYSDTENDPHIFTEWQIAYDEEFSELVFADTTPVDKQTILISLAILKPETTYYLRVRYSDLSGWSAWSDAVEFTTKSSADFLAENEGIEIIDTIESDRGDVVLSFKQDLANLPEAPSGYRFYNDIFSFRIEDIALGATISVTFQLYGPFQQDYKWFKYYPYLEQWDDTYATHIISGIGTNEVTIEFKDGGFGDIDGVENGVIVDPSGPASGISSGGEKEKDHCFIATACYDTAMASEVRILSRFRDRYLLTNPMGEGFVNTYYKVSPSIADFIREHPGLKSVVRGVLKPLIWMSRERE